MLAVADFVDLLAHELAGLRCWRFAGAPVFAGFLDRSFLRHGYSPCEVLPVCDLTPWENESRGPKFPIEFRPARHLSTSEISRNTRSEPGSFVGTRCVCCLLSARIEATAELDAEEENWPFQRRPPLATAGQGLRHKGCAMVNPNEITLNPELQLRDGRTIRSFADALMLVREHEARPG